MFIYIYIYIKYRSLYIKYIFSLIITCIYVYAYIPKYNCSVCIMLLMSMFSRLTIWYMITSRCALLLWTLLSCLWFFV